MLSEARIPYGTWGSSYFPAWQTSALAEVNIGQFAGRGHQPHHGPERRVPSQRAWTTWSWAPPSRGTASSGRRP